MFVFKQKTAYEMRISDWSSDVCSSDLHRGWAHRRGFLLRFCKEREGRKAGPCADPPNGRYRGAGLRRGQSAMRPRSAWSRATSSDWRRVWVRSEEHTSELQSLMRSSYAVFCLKKNMYILK